MKTKHEDGIEIYKSAAGVAKGTWRARLWENGRIIAESGEAYVDKAKAKSWARRVFYRLCLSFVHRKED